MNRYRGNPNPSWSPDARGVEGKAARPEPPVIPSRPCLR